jgi:hypothetical protein
METMKKICVLGIDTVQIGQIRTGMPWMLIRIRQKDADPTRSESITLSILMDYVK